MTKTALILNFELQNDSRINDDKKFIFFCSFSFFFFCLDKSVFMPVFERLWVLKNKKKKKNKENVCFRRKSIKINEFLNNNNTKKKKNNNYKVSKLPRGWN